MAEIEITPEMIEAGLPHLYRYHPDRGVSDEESVKAIFRAMCEARSVKDPPGLIKEVIRDGQRWLVYEWPEA